MAAILIAIHISYAYEHEKNIIKLIDKVLISISENTFDVEVTNNTIRVVFSIVFINSLFWIYNTFSKKKYMKGKEYGTARWATIFEKKN